MAYWFNSEVGGGPDLQGFDGPDFRDIVMDDLFDPLLQRLWRHRATTAGPEKANLQAAVLRHINDFSVATVGLQGGPDADQCLFGLLAKFLPPGR